MNSSLISWLSRGLWPQAAALALGALLAYAVVALLAAWLGGRDSVIASSVAAALCLMGAEGGLVACAPFRKTAFLWQGSLLGIFPRLGVPFGFGAIFYLRGRTLAEAGLLYYLVGFYPVILALETVILLLANAPDRLSSKVSKAQHPHG